MVTWRITDHLLACGGTIRRLTIGFLILAWTLYGIGNRVAAADRKGPVPPDFCAVPSGAPPQLPARLLEGVGVTSFPVTTHSSMARKFFQQGVAEIHSFWFREAERSCMQAAALAPDMPMAYWCISIAAAADYRPRFQGIGEDDTGRRDNVTVRRDQGGIAINPMVRSREAIAKAMGLRHTVTDRERLYIEAQFARRSGDGAAPAFAEYVRGLRALVGAYPDDLDARSMLALALEDGYDAQTGVPRKGTPEAIALLESVLRQDPNHIGALHYTIHAWEGSSTPERAWSACEKYIKSVPMIPHALHMPGHIYIQSGRIDDAVESFLKAAVVEERLVKSDALYPRGHFVHNIAFLVQALVASGRFKDAMTWTNTLLAMKETPVQYRSENQKTPWRQGYFSLIRTLVRFERWDLIVAEGGIPTYGRPEQQAWRMWAIGLARAAAADFGGASDALTSLKTALDTPRRSVGPLSTAALELDATIKTRSGDRRRGYEGFRRAIQSERALGYSEPSVYPRPVAEGFAETALNIGDFATAALEFREALHQEPGSGRLLFGLATALSGEGDANGAAAARVRAIAAWSKADRDLAQFNGNATRRTQ